MAKVEYPELSENVTRSIDILEREMEWRRKVFEKKPKVRENKLLEMEYVKSTLHLLLSNVRDRDMAILELLEESNES